MINLICWSDFQKYLLELSDKDFMESDTRNRPDTAWTVHAITNITFWTYLVSDHRVRIPNKYSIPPAFQQINKIFIVNVIVWQDFSLIYIYHLFI